VRNSLHQLRNLGFQKIVRDHERTNGRARIAVAGGDRPVDANFRASSRTFGWETEDIVPFQVDRPCSMFLFCSYGIKLLFQAALDAYVVRDANSVTVAWLCCHDDAQRYSVGKLSSDEARRIGKAIARIPEFMMPRQGFYPCAGGVRWRPDRPYHVAVEDRYIREHWDESMSSQG